MVQIEPRDPLAGEHVVGRTNDRRILVETRHHPNALSPRQGEEFPKPEERLRRDIAGGSPTFHNGRRLTVRPNDPRFYYEDNDTVADF